jgi:deoxycytidylate deaminase
MRENLLADILERLKKNEWLANDKKDVPVTKLVQEALREGSPKKGLPEEKEPPIMKGAQFTSTIDFIRAVHAEMAAITDAARHGLSTQDCVLYTTTFPCHDCAKHIVSAGIKRVVYVEPYSKSLVGELYSDSVVVDSGVDCGDKVRFEPFIGIAPKRYAELFSLAGRKRKNKDGTVKAWHRSGSSPQLPEYIPSAVARIATEQEEFKKFKDEMRNKGLTPEEPEQ